jgi:hypothetical protein
MDRPILSYMRIAAWTVPITLLANEDLSCTYNLPAEALYATSFRSTVSAVGGGTTSFLVCHSAGILQDKKGLASRTFANSLQKMIEK